MANSSFRPASLVARSAAFVVNGMRLEALEGRRYFANIDVTTSQDTVNPTDGLTSLREAVTLANLSPGADTITLAQNTTYTLNANNNAFLPGPDGRRAYGSQLTLVGDLTIRVSGTYGSAGVGQTYITSAGNGRPLAATGSDTRVTLDGSGIGQKLTLLIGGGNADVGGGLLVSGGAKVTTIATTFTNSNAVGSVPVTLYTNSLINGTATPAVGGGVYVTGQGSSLTMTNGGGVSHNTATGPAGGNASGVNGAFGGFYNGAGATGGGVAVDNGGTVSFTNVSIDNNLAVGPARGGSNAQGSTNAPFDAAQGGGVYVNGGSVAAFTGNTVQTNKAKVGDKSEFARAFGGGLYLAGNNAATLSGNLFTGNVVDGNTANDAYAGASVYGGAIASNIGLTLTNNDFLSNGANAGRGGEAVVISGANNSFKPGNNGDASGGAVFASGSLTVTGGSFSRNGVIGSAVDTLNQAPEGRGRDTYGGSGGTVRGGAVYVPSFGGNVSFDGVKFDTNVALAAAGGLGRQTDNDGYFDGYDGVDGQNGVRGGNGGQAFGGAITYDGNNTLSVTNSAFRSNIASGGRGGNGSRGMWGYNDGDQGGKGGTGGNGGNAGGGAISYGGLGNLVVTGSKLLKNLVGAGDGGDGGFGGRGGSADSGGSFGGYGNTGGTGGNGGTARGGAILTGDSRSQATISTSAVAGNDVRGGFGGIGGIGGSGMPGSEPATNTHDYDTAGGGGGNGGNGGQAGSAYGGGVAAQGGLTVRSSTVSNNTATGGNGGSGGLGGYGAPSVSDADGDGGYGGLAVTGAPAYGAGVYAAGPASVLSSTVVYNTVRGGAGGFGGSGGAAPGGQVGYNPTAGGQTNGAVVGGQLAVGATILAATVGATAAAATVTAIGGGLAAASSTLGFSFAAAAGASIGGLAGGIALIPVAAAGGALIATYGVFGIISSIAAIQAAIGGGDAGSAFLTQFAALTRYGNPSDNSDGPNAAALFNFNSSANRTQGASRPAQPDAGNAGGFGGGVYTLSGATVRNSIVATGSAASNDLSTAPAGGFGTIVVYGKDGFPQSPLPIYTNSYDQADQNDLVVAGGALTSNGHNLFGVGPKVGSVTTSGANGDKFQASTNYALRATTYDSTLTALPIAYTTESARDKGENLAATTTDQLGNARQQNGTEDIGAVEVKPFVQPAKLTSVWVSSTSWSQAFKDQLYKQGLATPTGFVYVDARRPLPWSNIDQIQLNFDQAVNLSINSLLPPYFYSGSQPDLTFKAFTNFGGGASGRWTLSRPMTGTFAYSYDPRQLVLPGDSLDPNALILLNTNTVPVVRGDVTGDGTYNNDDLTKLRLAVGTSTTVRPTVYNVWADIDGDGKVAANDLTLAQARVS